MLVAIQFVRNLTKLIIAIGIMFNAVVGTFVIAYGAVDLIAKLCRK